MKFAIAIIIAVVLGLIWYFRNKSPEIRRVFDNLPSSRLTINSVHQTIVSEILRSGVPIPSFDQGKPVKRRFIGNNVKVSISQEADEIIRSMRRRIVESIVQTVKTDGTAKGYNVPPDLTVQLIVDKSLTGGQTRVDMSEDYDTPPSNRGGHQLHQPTVRQAILSREDSYQDNFIVPADGSSYVIGRSTTADWLIDSHYISAIHASVRQIQDQHGNPRIEVEDRHSTNGTSINGLVLPPGSTRVLDENSELQLGPEVRIRLVIGDPDATPLMDWTTNPGTGNTPRF